MGIAGTEERKAIQAAVLKIQKNRTELDRKRSGQEAVHFYKYSIRESGMLYGEDGIRIKQNLTGRKPMWPIQIQSITMYRFHCRQGWEICIRSCRLQQLEGLGSQAGVSAATA